MGEFTTIFIFTDKTTEVFNVAYNSFAMGTIGIVVGIIILLQSINQSRKNFPKFVGIMSVLALIFWMALWGNLFRIGQQEYSSFNEEYQRLLGIYNNQQYKVTEGVVQVQHAQRWGGHETGDVVSISGVEFEFSDYDATTFAYNKTISHGGVLTQGVYARVYYADGKILRIDLKSSSPKSKSAQQFDS